MQQEGRGSRKVSSLVGKNKRSFFGPMDNFLCAQNALNQGVSSNPNTNGFSCGFGLHADLVIFFGFPPPIAAGRCVLFLVRSPREVDGLSLFLGGSL